MAAPLPQPLHLPQPPPLPGRLTPAGQVSTYLQYHQQYQSAPAPIYLHPNPISFYTHQDKVGWSPVYEDTAHRHTYSAFTNANRGGAQQTVGFFQTWGNTMVGRPAGAWQDDDWHAWLGATTRNPHGTGKTVLVWDSNAAAAAEIAAREKNRQLIFNDLSAPQRRFVSRVQNLGPVNGVWYGGSGNDESRICTPLAAQQVQGWMQNGLPQGPEQLSQQGYWQLR